MKGKAEKMKKIGITFFLILIMTLTFSFFASGAEDDFEKSVAAFPESYKPYLRELHLKYPKWKFEPMITGLDWQDVTEGEYGEKSLVQSSASSKIWKSHDSDDYNAADGSYVYKDGGFVQANRFAVEYFMDPRNFLTEDGIFQFELLGFSENYTVEMIEKVLKGSFMSQSKIEYLSYDEKTKEFTTVKSGETYAQVIYKAGKTHNINPCYLASKILNEIGSDGSYSVYGNHTTYPGIYNFYNIGATDGTGAIARGLLWAKGGSTNKTTYGRPWTTPEKSIIGGAQFLAEEYIAKGQFTGYLQRFNVNPESAYPLYSHQYMTNLTGALSQGYSTYASYAALGMLDSSITFSVPVYENMGGDNHTGSVSLADATVQNGTVNSTKAVLRTGPAKSYSNVKTSSGSAVTVTAGTTVEIISKDFTDSVYYLNILACPIWYKVKVTVNSVTYEGYIDGDFIDIDTVVYVPSGSFIPQYFKTDPSLITGLVSSDYRYCTVTDSNTLDFVKNGTVYVSAYTSNGSYDKIKYVITSDDYTVKNVKTSVQSSSVTVSADKNNSAKSYGFYLKDENQQLINGVEVPEPTYTFKNLNSGSKYTVLARCVKVKGNEYGPFTISYAVTKPEKATALSYEYDADKGLILRWRTAAKCTGYKIYSYDEATSDYTRIGTVKSNTGEFTVPEKYKDETCFMVRAYVTYGDITTHASYSDHLTISEELVAPSDLKQSGITSGGYTLSWSGSKAAESYRVYRYIPETKTYIAIGETDKTQIVINDVEPGYLCAYRVKGFRTVNGEREYSGWSEALWALLPTLKPVKVVSSEVKRDSITLSWDKVNNAQKYRVYRYCEDNKNLALIDETSDTSLVITGLEPDTEYKLYISAVVEGRGMSFESEMSETVNVKTSDLPPEVAVVDGIKATDNTLDSVTVSWNKVPDAEGYRVYQKKSGKWSLIAKTENNTYVCKGLASGKKYQFTVKAYTYYEGKTVMSPKYITFTTVTRAAKPSSVKAVSIGTSSVILEWNKVTGATGYRIYVKEGSSKKWKAVKTLTSNQTTVSNLKDCKKYTFAVKPYIKISGEVFWSEYTTLKLTTKLKNSSAKAVSNAKGTATVSWVDIGNEQGYQVWYSTRSDSGFTKISNYKADTVKINKKGLTSGKTYYFKVRAYTKLDGKYVYSAYSNIVKVKIK